MDTSYIIFGGLVVANIPVYVFLGWVLFDDLQGFIDSLRFFITPDILSAFRDEYFSDLWAEIKLGVLVSISAGCVYGEYALVQEYFF